MRISRESPKATGEYIRHTTVRTQQLIYISLSLEQRAVIYGVSGLDRLSAICCRGRLSGLIQLG